MWWPRLSTAFLSPCLCPCLCTSLCPETSPSRPFVLETRPQTWRQKCHTGTLSYTYCHTVTLSHCHTVMSHCHTVITCRSWPSCPGSGRADCRSTGVVEGDSEGRGSQQPEISGSRCSPGCLCTCPPSPGGSAAQHNTSVVSQPLPLILPWEVEADRACPRGISGTWTSRVRDLHHSGTSSVPPGPPPRGLPDLGLAPLGRGLREVRSCWRLPWLGASWRPPWTS